MSAPRSITGRLTLLPAPPTTEPALPAVVFAVQASEGEVYFIIRGERGFYTPDTWGEATLQPGDAVVASGTVAMRQDSTGNEFRALTLDRIIHA